MSNMFVQVGVALVLLSAATVAQFQSVTRIVDPQGASQDMFSNGNVDPFVYSVGPALDLDGDVLAVGSPNDHMGGVKSGTTVMYRRIGGQWIQQQKLAPRQAEDLDAFGTSVAVSGDLLAVGIPHDTVSHHTWQGSVQTYEWNGVRWVRGALLTSSTGEGNDRFGSSVSLDGDVLVVGAYVSDVGPHKYAGRAVVFRRVAGHWSEEAQLTSSDPGNNEGFGISVAVDGDVLIVGSWRDDSYGLPWSGSATIYRWDGSSWNEEQVLLPGMLETYSEFGRSVTVSEDVVVVGAWWGGVPTNDGRAVVYRFDGTGWVREAKLKAASGQWADGFGVSVSLSGDTLVVGAHNDSVGNSAEQGTATWFQWNGTSWVRKPKLYAVAGAARDHFGTSVAIDGDTIACGSPLSDIGAHTDQGAVYVFEPKPAPWTDLGGGSPGGAGVPSLQGVGQLVGGTPYALTLDGAPPGALLLAWVSFSPAPFDALGGTVHACPFFASAAFVADPGGDFVGSAGWPHGLPGATKVWFQFLVQDASVADGITLSNGLLATTP